jgi:hypothetical protein
MESVKRELKAVKIIVSGGPGRPSRFPAVARNNRPPKALCLVLRDLFGAEV